jgi:hypothetical protein
VVGWEVRTTLFLQFWTAVASRTRHRFKVREDRRGFSTRLAHAKAPSPLRSTGAVQNLGKDLGNRVSFKRLAKIPASYEVNGTSPMNFRLTNARFDFAQAPVGLLSDTRKIGDDNLGVLFAHQKISSDNFESKFSRQKNRADNVERHFERPALAPDNFEPLCANQKIALEEVETDFRLQKIAVGHVESVFLLQKMAVDHV